MDVLVAKKRKNSCVLVISDLHSPYYHPDTVPFLKAIKKKYKLDRVILTGDEIDGHSFSFHDKDPDTRFSPSSELERAIELLEPIYKLFPEADVLESNHGSLVYRRGKHAGIPRSVFKSYREILRAPECWNWHSELVIKLSDGRDCYFHHGKSSNGLRLSESEGMNVVQGHHHSVFDIEYRSTSKGMFWSMIVGCMIEDKELAFGYNKLQLKRPTLGCALIIEGHPKLLPMVLDEKGKWIGKIV